MDMSLHTNSRAMGDIKAILNGFKNLVWKTPEIEAIAMARAIVCSKCPSYQDSPVAHCKACGCFLPAKVRSVKGNNFCKLGKWQSLDM